ncbi:MAG: DUF2062 domain-containing protein [Sideroxydans sp.]|nr:DUF2062 domain-containing protein [Sideroxydans sp.]
MRHNRWLRWIGPALHHPQLWHITRRGVALAVALGIFFGLLVPITQIPLFAAAAVVFRANIPTAIASTLVTNPVTFAPIYYAAYHLGAMLISNDDSLQNLQSVQTGNGESSWIERIAALGKPLLLGLLILAASMGALAYLLVNGIWRLKIWLAWRRRRQRRLH